MNNKKDTKQKLHIISDWNTDNLNKQIQKWMEENPNISIIDTKYELCKSDDGPLNILRSVLIMYVEDK